MEILKKLEGDKATICLQGRLDTITAPELEKELGVILPNLKTLVFDFENLEYLSSAGLRVLLNSQKVMNKQGTMVVRHVNDTIMDVFDMTGFTSILTIED